MCCCKKWSVGCVGVLNFVFGRITGSALLDLWQQLLWSVFGLFSNANDLVLMGLLLS